MGLFKASKSKVILNAQGNPVNSYGKFESTFENSRPGSTASKAKSLARDFLRKSASLEKLALLNRNRPSIVTNHGNLPALLRK